MTGIARIRCLAAWVVGFAAACGGAAAPGDVVDGSPDEAESPADVAHDDASTAEDRFAEDAPAGRRVVLQLGDDVAPAVAARLEELLRAAADDPLLVLATDDPVPPLGPGSLVLAVGNAALARLLVADGELSGLAAGSLALRTGRLGEAVLVAARGTAEGREPPGHPNLGVTYAAYAALQEFGFGFLHPLEPTIPDDLLRPPPFAERIEQPRWPERGLHLHTMHPLELTDLVNGWGPGGPADADGWRAMLSEWERLLEWAVAQRLDWLNWVLLEGGEWRTFATSRERRERLTMLVERAHAWGLRVGVDASIALQQQHAFRLIPEPGDEAYERVQLRDRIGWLMGMGLDFLATESGTSEFTNPGDERMLAWMDLFAAELADGYGRPGFIKIHCSTGQFAESYRDPDTGEPLNFNFLPHYADPRLGVMPHTVQHYGLDDPAPTYGNDDFGAMREFLQEQAGRRPVVWHPESAYWVSFDIDVPLFLPLYAERRLHDLRLLAADEAAGRMGRGEHAGAAMQGQVVFSSGWEWGYWLPDVVAARAAWDPGPATIDDDAAFRALLADVLRPFGAAAPEWVDLLADTAAAQRALLIEGRVGGRPPSGGVVRRNGQAYLQGVETWDDVSDLAADLGLPGLSMTQPDRLGLVEMRNPLHAPPDYEREVAPLLAEMETTFAELTGRFETLAARAPAAVEPLATELAEAMRITALRAVQVHGLYDSVAADLAGRDGERAARLAAARAALDAALELSARRASRYRVEPDRIAAWRENPTAYEFAYLWTARTLFYWWRDEGKAVEQPISPCYLNIINPADIALGEAGTTDLVRVLRDVGDRMPWLGSLAECLAETPGEPVLPPPGLRP